MYYNNVEKIIMWERVIKVIFDEKKRRKKDKFIFCVILKDFL